MIGGKCVPNVLTSLRIVLTVAWMYVIRLVEVNSQHRTSINLAVILFVVICLTDLFDGKAARKMKAVSKFGSVFDVVADFSFISSSNILLGIYNLVPKWFILVVIFKFAEFLITSRIIKKYGDCKSSLFVFDYLGRVAAVNFFLIPGVFMLVYKGLDKSYGYILIYLTLLLVMISSCSRVYKCCKVLYKIKTMERLI
jgi:CDP-diacylglycerol--glycerol-3-phosphate 3-phosphatidyltransferase